MTVYPYSHAWRSVDVEAGDEVGQGEDEGAESHQQDAGSDDARLARPRAVVRDEEDDDESDEVVGGRNEPRASGRQLESGLQRSDDGVDDAVDDEAL